MVDAAVEIFMNRTESTKMAILASQALLHENKKIQQQNVTPLKLNLLPQPFRSRCSPKSEPSESKCYLPEAQRSHTLLCSIKVVQEQKTNLRISQVCTCEPVAPKVVLAYLGSDFNAQWGNIIVAGFFFAFMYVKSVWTKQKYCH